MTEGTERSTDAAPPLDYAGGRAMAERPSSLSKATWFLGLSALGCFCLGFVVGIVAVVPWFLAAVAALGTYVIAIVRKEPDSGAAVGGVLVAWLPLFFVIELNLAR